MMFQILLKEIFYLRVFIVNRCSRAKTSHYHFCRLYSIFYIFVWGMLKTGWIYLVNFYVLIVFLIVCLLNKCSPW